MFAENAGMLCNRVKTAPISMPGEINDTKVNLGHGRQTQRLAEASETDVASKKSPVGDSLTEKVNFDVMQHLIIKKEIS